MRIQSSVLVFLILVCCATAAQAHKVNMFAFVEGDKITVEGYFSDGKPAEKAQIQVFSPDGERLVQGTADENGIFIFDVPRISDLRVSLYAGMGHRAEYTVSEAELGGAAAQGGGANGVATPQAQADAGEPGGAAAPPAEIHPASIGIAADEVEAMVRKAVGEALHPVMRNLSELKEQRTFSDIVGGIGFIVGVIGVFFYLKARREVDRTANPGPGPSG